MVVEKKTFDISCRTSADGPGGRCVRIVYSNSDYSDAPLTLRGLGARRSVNVASDKLEFHLEAVRSQSPAAGLISPQRCRGAESVEEYAYQYDYTTAAAGRRTEIARSGTAMTEARADTYGYNERNELISAAKSGGPGSVPADEYAYQYEDIGNRLSSLDLGTNRTYTANFLNQYTLISNLCDSVTLCDDFVPQYDLDGNQTLVKTSTGVWHKIHGDSPRATPKSGWPRKEQVDLRYDEETNHGANPDKQKEWGEKWPTLN